MKVKWANGNETLVREGRALLHDDKRLFIVGKSGGHKRKVLEIFRLDQIAWAQADNGEFVAGRPKAPSN